MSRYEELAKEVKDTITDIFGALDGFRNSHDAIYQRNCCPHLNPQKFMDPTGTIQNYYQTYIECFRKQKKEADRLRTEIAEKKVFEKEKIEYQKWLDRKANWEKNHHSAFVETCPKVNEKVKEHFAKEERENLKKKLEMQLSADLGNIQDTKSEPLVEPLKNPLEPSIPPPPPPPALPTRDRSSSEVRSSESSNVSAAKKRDLDLFGDDDEFMNPPPPAASHPIKTDSPAISHKSHKKRSKSRSRSRSRSPKKHKKEKKEKKEKRERRDNDRHHTSESERHKHKKHKKQEKDRD